MNSEWCQVWGGDQVWLDTAHNASTPYNNNTHTAFAQTARPLMMILKSKQNNYTYLHHENFGPLCCLPCRRGLVTQRVLMYDA